MEILNKIPIVKDGVQCIIFVQNASCILEQKILLVQDHDDRGTGTGVKKLGLPGGGIEFNETPIEAILRELREEVALELKNSSLKKVGCFPKTRQNGIVNHNYLFFINLDYVPALATNDENEVSKVHLLTLSEIISLMKENHFHEGSVRLIFHFLNKNDNLSLNLPVGWKNYYF